MADDKLTVRPEDQVNSAHVPPEVIALASSLWAAAGGDVSKPAALAAAFHSHLTGEVIGRDVYLGTKGKVSGQLLESYRGIERRINQEYQCKYRPLTNEEVALHEVPTGARALACELYLLETWRKCIAMGVPYVPILGIYIQTAEERAKARIPATKSNYWILEKGSRKDALRQVPGLAVEPADVLAEAAAVGITPDVPETAILTREQAVAAVQQEAALQDQLTRLNEQREEAPLNNPAEYRPMRPRTGAETIAYLREQAAGDDRLPTRAQRDALTSAMALLFGADRLKWTAFKCAAFPIGPGLPMNAGQARATIEWIDATRQDDGEWVPDLDSVAEAQAVLEHAGQLQHELPK